MKAGPDLEALIAEHVFKLRFWKKKYSTSIADAWPVVEKLVCGPDRDYELYPFILREDRYGGTYSKGKWLCSFGAYSNEYENGPCAGDIEAMDYWEKADGKIAAGDTAPHAICLAALKAKGIELKEDA